VPVQVRLPKLGFAMNEGVVAEWLAPDGGSVVEGQPLYVLESEKTSQEIEAPASGVLRVVAATGETYEVGALVAEII